MARDPFTRLVEEHRQVEALLARLDVEGGLARQAVLDELEELLDGHLEREEAALHPLLAGVDGDAAREAGVEHGLVRDGLENLRQLAALPGFGAAVDMLGGALRHHVEQEEGAVFPHLRRELGADALDDLAGALSAGTTA
jgi:iron-sulfur cluster repair protein YtfE (RIC family)